MILQLFAVRDRQSAQFGTPMFLPSVGVCIRSLSDEVNGKGQADSIIAAHPDDFELFHFGTWDSNTARFDLFPDPKSVAQCSNLKLNGSV